MIRVIYDLQLDALQQSFQMDSLLLTNGFMSIMEAKNYSGTLHFLPDGQFIRSRGDSREGFPNPIYQVRRHRDLLGKWLTSNRCPRLMIEPQVVIANPSTIIDNPANLQSVKRLVTHAEQIPSRVSLFVSQHPRKLIGNNLFLLERKLINAHNNPVYNILKKYQLGSPDLLTGVYCDRCHRYSLERVHYSWICRFCGARSKDAHELMILDYFLLLGQTMTNEQCRTFLKIENREQIRYWLRKMGMRPQGSGNGKGLFYVRPSQKYYHDYYSRIKKIF